MVQILGLQSESDQYEYLFLGTLPVKLCVKSK